MTGVNRHVIGQGHEHGLYGVPQVIGIGGGEIEPTNAVCKQRVTDNGLFGLIVNKACTAGTMAGGMDDAPSGIVEGERIAVLQVVVRFGAGDRHSDEAGKVEHGIGAEIALGFVNVKGQMAKAVQGLIDTCDVIEVGMGQQNGDGMQVLGFDPVEHVFGFKAAIDDPAIG